MPKRDVSPQIALLEEQAPEVPDQCALALQNRVGGWVCTEQPEVAPSVEADSAVGYCQLQGCWDVYSGTFSEFDGFGQYGYGQTPLGNVTIFSSLRLNGAQTISGPRFTSTRGVNNLIVEGVRLYTSPTYPGGNPVTPDTQKSIGPSNLAAGNQRTWPRNYVAYEETAQTGSVAHVFTFNDPSSQYPGTWAFVVKSNLFFRQDGGGYRFGADADLPQDAIQTAYYPAP